MGFDEETFEPTYHLRLGLPGKSAGLDIATRLGMPEDIMRRARHRMSDRERDVTRFLSELHHRIEETQALEESLRARTAELERARRNWRASGRSAKPPSSRNWSAAPTRRWRGSKSRRRTTIGKIAQSADRRKADQDAQRRVSKAKRELREDFQTTVLATQDDSRQGRIQPLRIEEGMRVRLQRRARAGARAAQDRRRPHRSGSRLHEDAGLDRRRDRGAARAGGAGEAAEERELTSRRRNWRPCTRRST